MALGPGLPTCSALITPPERAAPPPSSRPQGAGKLSVVNSKTILERYIPRASLVPRKLDFTGGRCLFWEEVDSGVALKPCLLADWGPLAAGLAF